MEITDAIIKHVNGLQKHYREMFQNEKNDSNPVQLGRSFRVSDKLQFEFANALSKQIKSDKILVDYPISCTIRTQPLYPDILIIKSGIITGIIEMKIDLGFLNLESFGITAKKKSKYTYRIKDNNFRTNYENLINSQEVYYKMKSGKKNRVDVKINKKVKKKFLIITEENDHGRKKYFEQAIKDAGFEILFLLNKTTHPNRDYDLTDDITKELMKKSVKINSFFADL